MTILITFLTLVLVLTCLLLILLVLIQLPKKEAGAGLAFGAGATDALFGAGSGNALTKFTKYTAGVFLFLSLALGLMNIKNQNAGHSDIMKALGNQKPTASAPAPVKPAAQFSALPTTNSGSTGAAPSTNLVRLTNTNLATLASATNTAKTNTATPK